MADEQTSNDAVLNQEVDPMAYTTCSKDFRIEFDVRGAGRALVEDGFLTRLTSLARRVGDWFAARRQRQTDREIARLLARCGGRLTDSMEREIMQKALVSHWSLPG
jgi:hypothetical protein